MKTVFSELFCQYPRECHYPRCNCIHQLKETTMEEFWIGLVINGSSIKNHSKLQGSSREAEEWCSYNHREGFTSVVAKGEYQVKLLKPPIERIPLKPTIIENKEPVLLQEHEKEEHISYDQDLLA